MSMKTKYSFRYFWKEGIRSIFVHSFMSISAISIIVACLLITGSVALMSVNVDEEVKNLAQQTQIAVFIDSQTSRDDAIALKNKILKIENVADATFIPKEQAFEDYKETLGEDAVLLEGLENDNPLRDGYMIELVDLSLMDNVITQLEKLETIKNIRNDQKTANTLITIREVFMIISFILIISLGGISIFIISNTVKLAMLARSEEISIMKMVGATNWFIRLPFIIEGAILGSLAGIIGFFAQWGIYSQVQKIITEAIGVLNIVDFTSVGKYVAIIFILSGGIIGLLGSGITIRKFLDV